MTLQERLLVWHAHGHGTPEQSSSDIVLRVSSSIWSFRRVLSVLSLEVLSTRNIAAFSGVHSPESEGVEMDPRTRGRSLRRVLIISFHVLTPTILSTKHVLHVRYIVKKKDKNIVPHRRNLVIITHGVRLPYLWRTSDQLNEEDLVKKLPILTCQPIT